MGPVHRGGTTGNLGLTWGWRTLSPRWRGAWGGETPAKLPLDYKTPSMDKVAVILTDGNNAFHDNDTSTANNSVPASDFTGYGRIETLNGNSNGTAQARRDAGRATLDSRMATTCTAMKAQGILIYTIIFGAAPDATAQDALHQLRDHAGDVLLRADQRRRSRPPSAPSAASSPTCASWSDGDAPLRSSAPPPLHPRRDRGRVRDHPAAAPALHRRRHRERRSSSSSAPASSRR